MPRFDFSCFHELKEALYHSCIHDARIMDVQYNYVENRLAIETFHEFYNVKTSFVFHGVDILVMKKGDWLGNDDEIIIVTLEDPSDCPYCDCNKTCTNEKDKFLYLMFQMFSGDEIHIIAKDVVFEIYKQ